MQIGPFVLDLFAVDESFRYVTMKTVPTAQELAAERMSTKTDEAQLAESDETALPQGEVSSESIEPGVQFSRSSFRKLFGKFQLAAVFGTVGSQVGIFGILALHSIVLARLLGPTQRGEYATVVFYSQVLVYAGLLGTLFSIARRAAQDAELRPALANASMRVGAITGVGCFGVVCLLAWFALPAEKAYLSALCIFAALQLPFEHGRLALLAVDHGSGDFRRYNTNRLLTVSIFPLLLGIGWLAGVLTLNVVVFAVVLTSILGFCQLVYSHSEVRWSAPSAPKAPVLIKEGLPYASAYFAAQLLGRLDMLLMLWFMSFAAQGYYAVAIAAAGLMHVVPNALALFAFNAGAKTAVKQTGKTLRWAALVIFGIQFLSAATLALILGPLMTLLFGAQFQNSLPMTLALLPGLAIDGIGTVAEGYLRGKGRPFSTLRPRILGAAVMLPAVFLFQDSWHELAIPMGASLAHAVSGIAILWVLLKDHRSSVEVEEQ